MRESERGRDCSLSLPVVPNLQHNPPPLVAATIQRIHRGDGDAHLRPQQQPPHDEQLRAESLSAHALRQAAQRHSSLHRLR